ncbi:MAG: hypothetical protein HZA91_16555 [Verrucomicrobia bacterium]|nr:hypothetical protein [Verrucomicrobiota bacterium]
MNRNRPLLSLVVALVLIGAHLTSPAARALIVSFDQLDWLSDAGGYSSQNSDFGQANLLFSPGDIGSFTFNPGDSSYYGFMNVVTDTSSFGGSPSNWAVQNLPLRFDSASGFNGRISDSVWFDLTTGAGTDVPSLNYNLSITSAPLGAPFFGPMTPISVNTTSALFGGLDGTTGFDPFSGGTGQAAPPPAQNFVGAAVGQAISTGATIAGTLTNIPSVNEATNACAPGSAARSLVYLRQQMGINETNSAQTIYNSLTQSMATTVAGGTSVSNFMAGKQAYTTANGLPVTTTQTNSIPAAIQALRSTNDVEIMIWWGRNAGGTNLGGHAAMVTGIIAITNAAGQVTGYTISYIDDAIQGDGIATNNQHILQVNTNGTFAGFGTGAQLIGFQVEQAPPQAVPEPAGATLLILGLSGVAAYVRSRGGRKSRSNNA